MQKCILLIIMLLFSLNGCYLNNKNKDISIKKSKDNEENEMEKDYKISNNNKLEMQRDHEEAQSSASGAKYSETLPKEDLPMDVLIKELKTEFESEFSFLQEALKENESNNYKFQKLLQYSVENNKKEDLKEILKNLKTALPKCNDDDKKQSEKSGLKGAYDEEDLDSSINNLKTHVSTCGF